MSSRFPHHDRDSRYTPRDRSPPPRFTDRRPFGGRPPSPINRDAPRGPRISDLSREGPIAPSGPRRGGFVSRGDYRELRDAPPLSEPGRRPWRDGRDSDVDYDRRDRRSPPRTRSPPRARRDSRERPYPNDLDIPRTRRNSRDGPPSAGSSLSDAPPRFSGGFGRGGLGRARGRGDWDYRNRGRAPYIDDRDTFRARSRSPRGSRIVRDLSRDSRDYDRRDDPRNDRRDDDRRFVRDDRDTDRFRRDVGPGRIESRHPSGDSEQKSYGDLSGPSTPHPLSAGSLHPDRAANIEALRDNEPPRRASVVLDAAPREPRRELEKGEIYTPRSEQARERLPPRAASPSPPGPQVPPSVPAFGGVPLFMKAPLGPTSNVWRAPQLQSRPSFGATPITSTTSAPAPKVPSTTPKPQIGAFPPTAPKAERPPEIAPVEPPANSPAKAEEPMADETPPPSRLETTPVPTGPSRSPSLHSTSPRMLNAEPPKGPRAHIPLPGPSTAAKYDFAHPPAFPRSPQPQPASIRPDTFSAGGIPSGPRAGSGTSASPPGIGANVPTGPKADRLGSVGPRTALFGVERGPPSGPRAGMAGPTLRNPAWIRQGAPMYPRASSVTPAKRDAAGDEKQPGAMSIRRSPVFERSSSYNDLASKPSGPPTARSEPDEDMSHKRPWVPPIEKHIPEAPKPVEPVTSAQPMPGPDVQMVDVQMVDVESDGPASPSPKAPEQPDPEHESSDDEDLLGEDFLAEIEKKFSREKAQIQAKMIDLSQPTYRATSPLARIALLDSLTPADLPFQATVEEPAAIPSPTLIHRPLVSSGTPLPTVEKPQTDLLTPKEEQQDVTMEDASLVIRTFAPPPALEEIPRTPTPEISSLPYLGEGPPTPVSDPDRQIGIELDDCKDAIAASIVKQQNAEIQHRSLVGAEYANHYRAWMRHARALERKEQEEAEAKERAQKQAEKVKTPEPDAATSAAAATLPLPTPTEGRRSHRFASQLDWEIAIQASLETAKEDQAKQEREAQKVQADMDKEAEIPPMATDIDIVVRRFTDTNQARIPARAIEIFDFVPPEDDFTEEEHNILVAGYKAEPKAWGKIAQSLPGRTYKDCINHYYSTKWSTDYKSLKDRRRKGFRGRGAKALRSARSNVLISGLGAKYDDDGVPAVTETGRPRRLAAPTFGEKEAADADTMLAGSTAKKLAMTAAENVVEKTGKRQKVAKEKGTRKAKNQPLAARPVTSPTKVDKERKERGPTAEPGDLSREGVEKWPIMPGGIDGAMNGLGQTSLGQLDDFAVLQERPAPVPAANSIAVTTERPRAHSQQQRAGASSYWSVQEQTDFKRYVTYYGTDFLTISSLLGTKTHIMVKNFFERKKLEGLMPDVIQAALDADEKRARGENLGPPPTPSAARRRIESVQPPAPRALAPNTDAMQVDSSPPSQAKAPAQTSPPHTASSRMSVMSPPAVAAQVQSASTAQPQAQPSRSQVPRMGFFMDSHADRRPASLLQQPFSTAQAPHQPPFSHLQQRQEDVEVTKREEPPRREAPVLEEDRRQHYLQGSAPSERRGPRNAQESDVVHRQPEPQRTISNQWPYEQNQRLFSRPNQPLTQPAHSSPSTRPPFEVTSMSPRGVAAPPANVPHTHSSTWPPATDTKPPNAGSSSQAQQTVPPPPAAPTPKQESKTSNLMSLLNPVMGDSEPEKKREKERPQPPQPTRTEFSYRAPELSGRTSSPKSFADVNVPQRPFYRPGMPPSQGSSSSVPGPEDHRYREHRDSWPPQHRQLSQQYASNPLRTGSPLGHQSQQGQPSPSDFRSSMLNSGHRSMLSSLNAQPRQFTSPPPPPPPPPPPVSQAPHPHSRSSSISMQGQLPPSRIETPPQEGARENRTLSANPYAQVQPPPSQPASAHNIGHPQQSRAYQEASHPQHHHQHSGSLYSPYGPPPPPESHYQPQAQYPSRPTGVADVQSVLGRDRSEVERDRRLAEERQMRLAQEEREFKEREALHVQRTQQQAPGGPPPPPQYGHATNQPFSHGLTDRFGDRYASGPPPPSGLSAPQDPRVAHSITPTGRFGYAPPPPSLTPADARGRDAPTHSLAQYEEALIRERERQRTEERPGSGRGWTIPGAMEARRREEQERQERQEREMHRWGGREREAYGPARGFGGRG